MYCHDFRSRLLLYESLVVSGREETLDGTGISHLALDDPALAVGVLIDQLGCILELSIGLLDVDSTGSDQVRDRLDRLDGAECLTALYGAALAVDVDEYDVSQLLLSEVGDTDGCLLYTSPSPRDS